MDHPVHATEPGTPSLSPATGARAADGIVPAPWSLTGRGVVVLLAARSRAAAAPGLAGRFSAVAFVDYSSSPVGPYRELLHVPSVVRWNGATGPTVRDIWVDLEASAISGNANWGLTKSVIRVDREPIGGGAERWVATDHDGVQLAKLVHRPWGPWLPVGKPGAGPRLLQRRDGNQFETPVSLLGLARASRVASVAFDADRVVDLDQHRVIGAVALPAGRLGFLKPRVMPLP
jgi:hypothetical protein